MKRMGVLLAVALTAASILSGCILVPVEGEYRGGWHHRRWHHHGGWHHPGP